MTDRVQQCSHPRPRDPRGQAIRAVDIMPLVYDELRGLAARYLSRERCDHTLQATALVHEAFLRLASANGPGFGDRVEFFAAAANTVRNILVDHARRRGAAKRGGDRRRLMLRDDLRESTDNALDLIDLDDALRELTKRHGRPGRVAELRFFGGLTVEETARILSVSRKTATLDWNFARAWLSRELAKDEPAADEGSRRD